MTEHTYGRILEGNAEEIARSCALLEEQPVDHVVQHEKDAGYSMRRTTLASPVSVTGTGTFLGHEERTMCFHPTSMDGWWFKRTDLPASMAIAATANNIWKTQRNIVLASGSPHNYMRMVEHIVALRLGMGLDNVMIRLDSGDPPLFDESSLAMVKAIRAAGIRELDRPALFVTVKEPVTMAGPRGSFLAILPSEGAKPRLDIDCAINFKSAIGKQRIQFTLSDKLFDYASEARTNATLGMMIYCKTIGKIFADVRHLGYTNRNILIARRRKYWNEPKLMHEGRSLEAVWHRAMLDLLAAVALIGTGRLVGRIVSYKAGHTLDAKIVAALYREDLLEQVSFKE